MNPTAPHLEFAPPRTGGSLRALGLAIVAHTLLLAVLTLGVQWKSDPVQQTFEAELWSSVPTEAAPPPPEPVVAPEPPKPEEPAVKPIPVVRPDAVVKAEAEIAIAKDKEKERAKKLKQLALEKLEQEKQLKAEAEKEKQDRLKKEQADKEKQAKLDQQRKLDQVSQANATKAREDQMKRMEKLAGATGSGAPSSTGTAAQQSGPSGSYAGRIVAAIVPNITYPENLSSNPRTEVEIRVAPSGIVLSKRITQSSGIPSWDDAVLRAIEKTEKLPKDTDGSVQPVMVLGFRPKDLRGSP